MAKILINPPPKPAARERGFTVHATDGEGNKVRRLIPLTDKQAVKAEQWEMDYRFVKEVEYLEREGRVSSRAELELAVGMETGAIATIRNGMRGVSPVNIVRLWKLYRGDRNFIELGTNRDTELNKPYIPAIGRLNIYDGFYHRYSSVARWRVGPRPETRTPHPTLPSWSAYFPDDIDNEKWSAPARNSIKDFMDKE